MNAARDRRARAGRVRYPNRLGPKLRARREELDLSQQAVADAIGYSQNTISRYETADEDYPPPPASVLNPLARVIGVPVVEMLSWAGYDVEPPESPELTPEMVVEIVSRASSLSPDARHMLQELVKFNRSRQREPRQREKQETP